MVRPTMHQDVTDGASRQYHGLYADKGAATAVDAGVTRRR